MLPGGVILADLFNIGLSSLICQIGIPMVSGILNYCEVLMRDSCEETRKHLVHSEYQVNLAIAISVGISLNWMLSRARLTSKYSDFKRGTAKAVTLFQSGYSGHRKFMSLRSCSLQLMTVQNGALTETKMRAQFGEAGWTNAALRNYHRGMSKTSGDWESLSLRRL